MIVSNVGQSNGLAQRIKTRLTNLDAAIKEKAGSDSDANARIKRSLYSSAQKKVQRSAARCCERGLKRFA
jgi:hypothetical protein